MRHTGLPIIGDVPWGTHFCQFYRDQQDLIDLLVPYFKAGLENDEFCMWITSEPLGADAAAGALARELPDLEQYVRRGQIEILDYSQWYTAGGKFDSGRVLAGWVAKLESARERGFDGLRLTGNTFWLEKDDWQSFVEYEAAIDSVIGRYPMLAMCTYSLVRCGAVEIIDVVSNHAFALIKQAGEWRIMESLERNRLAATLRQSEGQHQVLFESMLQGAVYRDAEGKIIALNPAAERILGRRREEIVGNLGLDDQRPVRRDGSRYPIAEHPSMLALATGREVRDAVMGVYNPEQKAYRWVNINAVPIFRPGEDKPYQVHTIFADITERIATEEALRSVSEQRRLSMEAAGLGAWDYRFDTGEVFWDERCRNMFGVSIGDQIDYFEAIARIHPEDRTPTNDAVNRAIAGESGGNYHREFRVVWPDGSIHWVASHGRVYFEGEGPQRRAVRFIGVNMEITERKEAEEALRHHREWLRVTLTSIGDGVIATDTAGLITFINPVAARLSAWSEEDALGRPIDDVLRIASHENSEGAGDIVSRVLREGRVVPLADRTSLLTRDGREIPIEDSAAPIRDEAGRTTGAVLVFHDVTETYRARQALRESEQRVRLKLASILSPEGDIAALELGDILDAPAIQSIMDDFYRLAGVPMAIIDLKGQVLVGVGWQKICTDFHRANEETCRNCIDSDTQLTMGVPPGEFRLYKCKNNMWDIATPLFIGGRHVGNLFSGQFFFDDEPVDSRLFRGQAHRYGFDENRYLAALEEVPRLSRDAVNAGINFLAKLGQTLSLLSYSNIKLARSLAERDRLMRSLRESEERERARAAELEAIMDAVPFAMFIARDPECRSVAGNRASHELLRIESGRNLSKTASDGEAPRNFRVRKNGVEIAPQELPVQVAARTGRAVENCELELEFEDGHRRYLLGHAVPLRSGNGGTCGAVAGFLDVTERKRIEERLREAQKMESIGLLAGGIAHDFNNLLVGIVGNASLAETMLAPGHPVAEILKGILKSGEHAAHLTRQMLAYAGKGRFVVEPVNLSELVGESIALVQSSISGKIALHLELDRSMAIVESDPSQMRQVFTNLALNAAEAIGDRPGIIVVKTGVVTVDPEYVRESLEGSPVEPGRFALLQVRDTGCGMDPATKARIFDPFFTTKFQGRGLGLAAVAGIVRAQNGAIQVESSPGDGSTFSVLLPVSAARRPAAPAAREPEQLDGSGTILIVDDEPMVCELARRALEKCGYDVLVADGGPRAVELMKSHAEEVRLVILDLGMPGMSGGDTLPELRAIKPDLDVLICSGYSEMEAVRVFGESRISGFLQKPYTVRELAGQVKSVLA
jgi:PAS domain S-box-containing protein